MKKIITGILLLSVLVFTFACQQDYRNVPPQFVGRILTPTGWEDKLYSPGQVNIGDITNGRGNSLVLIQTSAFQIKESFLGSQANQDGEDHRVFTKDKTPMSVDIRLLFTSPDIEKDNSSVKRFFTMGNPVNKDNDPRVQEISLASIYEDQAQLQVRGKIRKSISAFENFNDAFEHTEELNKDVRETIVKILRERYVPLILVDCQISNMKPDALVWENQIKEQAADAEIRAMQKLESYLATSPVARMIYQYGKLKEIAATAGANGNTVIIMGTDDEKIPPIVLNRNVKAEANEAEKAPPAKAEEN